MKINQLAVAVVAALALMSQASFAQTTGAGANDASRSAIGSVTTTTMVVGAVVVGIAIVAASNGNSTGTTGSTTGSN